MDTSAPFSLRDKSAFITGGASGIGLGTCQRFLQEGARVIVADLQPPPQSLLDAGAIFLEVNMCDRDKVIHAFTKAEAAVGKLDVIIHNAGKPGNGKHITDSDEEVLDGVVDLKPLRHLLHPEVWPCAHEGWRLDHQHRVRCRPAAE